MPTRARSSTGSMSRSVMSWSSMAILPSTRADGMVSFIRLMQRRNVDLPQPDGPMKAVTALSAMSSDTSNSACFWP